MTVIQIHYMSCNEYINTYSKIVTSILTIANKMIIYLQIAQVNSKST